MCSQELCEQLQEDGFAVLLDEEGSDDPELEDDALAELEGSPEEEELLLDCLVVMVLLSLLFALLEGPLVGKLAAEDENGALDG